MSSHMLRRRDLPFQKNLKIVVGDTFRSPIVRLLGESGSEISLTGYDIDAELRVGKLETAEKVLDFSVIISGGAVQLKLTAAQTLNARGYDLLYYDVRYTAPDGEVTTYWSGYVEIEESVTA